MDLDLLAESDSDSDSSHSNGESTAIQRNSNNQTNNGSDAGTIVCCFNECFQNIHLNIRSFYIMNKYLFYGKICCE